MNAEQYQEGSIVMPFYIVCDVSGSMTGDIAAVNQAIGELQQKVKDSPMIADLTQIGIISFGSDARVELPVSDLSQVTLPTLSIRGATNYGAAFRELRKAIESDRKRLGAGASLRVFRPCAFFLTDGAPTDSGWEQAFAQAFHYEPETGKGFKAYPRFVPFGFRDAKADVLAKLAYPAKGGQYFMARDGTTVAQALNAILELLAQTVISSGGAGLGGSPQHVFPEEDMSDVFDQGGSQYAGGDYLDWD